MSKVLRESIPNVGSKGRESAEAMSLAFVGSYFYSVKGLPPGTGLDLRAKSIPHGHLYKKKN